MKKVYLYTKVSDNDYVLAIRDSFMSIIRVCIDNDIDINIYKPSGESLISLAKSVANNYDKVDLVKGFTNEEPDKDSTIIILGGEDDIYDIGDHLVNKKLNVVFVPQTGGASKDLYDKYGGVIRPDDFALLSAFRNILE